MKALSRNGVDQRQGGADLADAGPAVGSGGPDEFTSDALGLGPRAQRTRELILDTSRDLFISQGYAATRIAHITAACGISRAGFYTYFRDKREVFNAIGHAAYTAVLDVTGKWERLPRPAAYADIEQWARDYFTMMDAHGPIVFFSQQAVPDDETFRASRTRMELRVAWTFGARLQSRQRTPSSSPDALGVATLAMLDRSWYMARKARLPIADADLISTAAQYIAAILAA